MFDDFPRVRSVAADISEAKRGELPQILALHLGGGYLKLIAQAREQRFDDLAFILQRLAGEQMQGNTTCADKHSEMSA